MRVRVVDDDHTIIELLTLILDELEEIEAVITGSDFDRLLHPEAWEGIDGALIDLNLRSETTGADLLAYLKANHPDLRRVAFTAMQLPPEDIQGLADVVLTKPASARVIAEALRG